MSMGIKNNLLLGAVVLALCLSSAIQAAQHSYESIETLADALDTSTDKKDTSKSAVDEPSVVSTESFKQTESCSCKSNDESSTQTSAQIESATSEKVVTSEAPAKKYKIVTFAIPEDSDVSKVAEELASGKAEKKLKVKGVTSEKETPEVKASSKQSVVEQVVEKETKQEEGSSEGQESEVKAEEESGLAEEEGENKEKETVKVEKSKKTKYGDKKRSKRNVKGGQKAIKSNKSKGGKGKGKEFNNKNKKSGSKNKQKK